MKKVVALLITSLINRDRQFLHLPIVKYDFNLHNFLENNVTNNGSYFYESTNDRVTWTVENNTRYCDLRGCFLTPLENQYMFRDTYKDSIVKIFRYRLSQRNCNHTDFVDGTPCSWFYHYYPVMMQPDFKSFACKSLNFQGRFVPGSLKNKQFKSFWCFMDAIPYYWS